MSMNNGILRGTLYIVQSIGLVLLPQFTVWETEPPKNHYSILILVVASVLAAGNALRGFLDQHLSRNPPEKDANKPVTVPLTVQVDPNQKVETTVTT